MNTYEELQDKACKDGIDVIDYPFNSDRIDGLYCDGTIAIRKNIETSTEKACVLAEGLAFTNDEIKLIFDVMKKDMSEEEVQQFNKLRSLMNLPTWL